MKKILILSSLVLLSVSIIVIYFFNINITKDNYIFIKLHNTEHGRIITIDTSISYWDKLTYHKYIDYYDDDDRMDEMLDNWHRDKIIYQIPLKKYDVRLDEYVCNIEIVNLDSLEKMFNEYQFVTYESIKVESFSSIDKYYDVNEYQLINVDLEKYGIEVSQIKLHSQF